MLAIGSVRIALLNSGSGTFSLFCFWSYSNWKYTN